METELKKILVVITGGTIEALYSPQKGTPYHVPLPPLVGQSAIPELLHKEGLAEQCELWPLAMADSKLLTEDILEQITKRIVSEHYARAIIVQGTDMMPANGRLMEQLLNRHKAKGVRVIFTGAMKPLRNEQGEWHPRHEVDGWTNVRQAVMDAADDQLAPGVYLEMGEGPWNPHDVEKEVVTHSDGQRAGFVKHSGFVVRKKP